MLALGFRTWCLIGAVLATAGFLLSGGLQRLLPSEDSDLRTGLARRWAQKVSVTLPELPGRPTLEVAPVINDSDGILTSELRDWIGRQNVRMVRNGIVTESRELFGFTEEPESLDDISLAQGDAEYVVVCRVDEWVTYPAYDARLVGVVRIVQVSNGRSVFEKHLALPEEPRGPLVPDESTAIVKSSPPARSKSDTAPVAAAASESVDTRPQSENLQAAMLVMPKTAASTSFSFLHGLISWAIVVVLVPIGTSDVVRNILRRRSNAANGLLLTGWTLGVLGLAWMFWGWALSWLTLCVGLTAAVGLALVYFGFVCSRLNP